MSCRDMMSELAVVGAHPWLAVLCRSRQSIIKTSSKLKDAGFRGKASSIEVRLSVLFQSAYTKVHKPY